MILAVRCRACRFTVSWHQICRTASNSLSVTICCTVAFQRIPSPTTERSTWKTSSPPTRKTVTAMKTTATCRWKRCSVWMFVTRHLVHGRDKKRLGENWPPTVPVLHPASRLSRPTSSKLTRSPNTDTGVLLVMPRMPAFKQKSIIVEQNASNRTALTCCGRDAHQSVAHFALFMEFRLPQAESTGSEAAHEKRRNICS